MCLGPTLDGSGGCSSIAEYVESRVKVENLFMPGMGARSCRSSPLCVEYIEAELTTLIDDGLRMTDGVNRDREDLRAGARRSLFGTRPICCVAFMVPLGMSADERISLWSLILA